MSMVIIMEETKTISQDLNSDLVTTSRSGTNIVKPINKETIHKICSGQVVLSLAVAVKELVENALDAGATIIEIKLKDHGSNLVEVSDNGSGVIQKNFAALTRKHCTSKITDFTDLETVKTLGFRGEALSSLCALCDVTITTRHESTTVGTKITYDHNGEIVDECTAPRLQGTTVSLANLFCTLPVRRKEFVKNSKREFTKMCQLLYAYCLVSVGVKITCFNLTSSGTKTKVVSTQGSNTVRDNIINVFGAKQISSLIEMLATAPEESILQEYGVRISAGETNPFEFDCFISSAMHGSGRSTTDRQFFYINSRPCEPGSVIKLCNEIYRQYNVNQYPFIYMNILTSNSKVDVNVTPDKRQIFLEKEKLLLSVIKASLVEAFKNFPSTYKIQNLNLTSKSDNSIQTKFTQKSPLKGLKRSNSENNALCLGAFTKKAKKTDEKVDVTDLKAIFGKLASKQNATSNSDINGDHAKNDILGKDEPNKSVTTDKSCDKTNELDSRTIDTTDKENKTREKVDFVNITSNLGDEVTGCEFLEDTSKENIEQPEIVCKLLKTPSKNSVTDKILNTSKFDEKLDSSIKIEANVLDVSLSDIQDCLNKQLMLSEADEEKTNCVLFRTQISPSTNEAAEQELQKRITKDKFRDMKILGQFNLGFIITRLGDDLFIIDQHATDEKYNFELLQLNTVLKTQVLVNPKPLNLTADKECLLIENIEVFRKNGFVFDIEESAEPNQKIKLTAIPISKNYAFGVDDIDELLFMLQVGRRSVKASLAQQVFFSQAENANHIEAHLLNKESAIIRICQMDTGKNVYLFLTYDVDSSHTMCRPTRVRQMFASRACRKSVMIGKALTHADMRKLVDHMGEIDQPWNCPHGRPTMRHLVNLNLIQTK